MTAPAQRDHAEEQFLALRREWSNAGTETRTVLLEEAVVGARRPECARSTLQDAYYDAGVRARKLFLTELCMDSAYADPALRSLMTIYRQSRG